MSGHHRAGLLENAFEVPTVVIWILGTSCTPLLPNKEWASLVHASRGGKVRSNKSFRKYRNELPSHCCRTHVRSESWPVRPRVQIPRRVNSLLFAAHRSSVMEVAQHHQETDPLRPDGAAC